MKNFYISDWHYGHNNIIHLDNRPYKNVEEMNEALIDNWNSVVTNEDTVYSLGDMFWCDTAEATEVLKKLNGKKVLVIGNHDRIHDVQFRKQFEKIEHYVEVKDNSRRVLLSHYPMPFYRGDYNPNIIHLYGHIHTTIEHDFMEYLKEYINKHDNRGSSKHKCQFYNAGAMCLGYIPRTLDEILAIYN